MSDGGVIVQEREARVIRAFGDEMRLTISGAETGGKYAQWLSITQPGGGPPPHIHANEDEWFYVVEGRVSFLANGVWTEAGPGSGAFLPRGSLHTFRNAGETPLHMVITVAPAGFEDFFAEASQEFSQPGGPDIAKVIEIAGRFGITFPS